MEAEIRRKEILRHLCVCRFDTVQNMAALFSVSERTIRRDINILSFYEPIYTKTGRYSGGVYIAEDYKMDRLFFTDSQVTLLNKIYEYIDSFSKNHFSAEEKETFKRLINDGTMPSNDKRSG